MSEMTDTLLRRRPASFFKGRVLLLSEETGPNNWPGYYRLVDITEGNYWHYRYIGTEEPPNEPIYRYHTIGQSDLWAVPRTVFPWAAFWGWGILGFLVMLMPLIWGGEPGTSKANAFGLVAMFVVPIWVFGVGFAWLDAIEPVFATKMAVLTTALSIAWSVKRVHERNAYQARQTQLAYAAHQRTEQRTMQSIEDFLKTQVPTQEQP